MWFLFPNQESAIIAEAKITENIRSFCAHHLPERVSDQGLLSLVNGKISPNAPTTERWAVPMEATEGWVFKKPDQQSLGLIPLEVALEDVQAEEIDSVSFPERMPYGEFRDQARIGS